MFKKQTFVQDLTLDLVKKYALKYLERFSSSENNIKFFLKRKIALKHPNLTDKNIINEYIENTLIWLKKLNYINDDSFTNLKLQSFLESGYSLKLIELKLAQKSVTKEVINLAIDKLLENNSEEDLNYFAALRFCQKRGFLKVLAEKDYDVDVKNKIIQKFAAKGFSYSLTLKVMDLRKEVNLKEEIDSLRIKIRF